MQMLWPVFSTNKLFYTKRILDYYLPSIYNSKCFNNGELPFKIEVQNTEVGHLFEHILLEYLCIFKIKAGFKKATYMGETRWNWKRDKRGTFKITVSSFKKEKKFFKLALKESISLFNLIIRSKEREVRAPLFT